MSKKPLVVSYPRSGVNWFCRAFETITGQRSPGQDRGIVSNKQRPAFRRTHTTESVRLCRRFRDGVLDSVLLLLRDPAWSYARRHTCPFPFSAYIHNIEFFDRCSWPKKLVYYDELFTEASIYDIVDWMEIPHGTFEDFEQTLAASHTWYATTKHPRYDPREPTMADRQAAHCECRTRLGPVLYRKYLGRYAS